MSSRKHQNYILQSIRLYILNYLNIKISFSKKQLLEIISRNCRKSTDWGIIGYYF